VRFVADESVDGPIVRRLRDDGHEVGWVAEDAPGEPDEAVFARAAAEGVPLLTADKDFGELVFRRGLVGSGVVLVRLAGLSPERKAAVVADAVREHAAEFEGNFAVVAPRSVRIRRGRVM